MIATTIDAIDVTNAAAVIVVDGVVAITVVVCVVVATAIVCCVVRIIAIYAIGAVIQILITVIYIRRIVIVIAIAVAIVCCGRQLAVAAIVLSSLTVVQIVAYHGVLVSLSGAFHYIFWRTDRLVRVTFDATIQMILQIHILRAITVFGTHGRVVIFAMQANNRL